MMTYAKHISRYTMKYNITNYFSIKIDFVSIRRLIKLHEFVHCFVCMLPRKLRETQGKAYDVIFDDTFLANV